MRIFMTDAQNTKQNHATVYVLVCKMRVLICLFCVLWAGSALAENVALVIIDMQPQFVERKGFDKNPGNQDKLREAVDNQLRLIREAKKNNLPIVLVEYDKCGPTCRQLAEEVADYHLLRRFQKKSNGLFQFLNGASKEVMKFLDAHKVSQLVVSGANGGACVQCTIKGAIQAGYGVWTDEMSIIDFNSENFAYPYHYESGAISLNGADQQSRFVQQGKINSFEEIMKRAENAQNRVHAKALRSRLKCFLEMFFEGQR